MARRLTVADFSDCGFDDCGGVLVKALQEVDRARSAVIEAKAAIIDQIFVESQRAASVNEFATFEHAVLEVPVVENDTHIFENFFVV
jgi:hypothetical protein